jgi:CBS-domain-containing membrane protein
MKARDVMVSPVITAKPYSSVKEVAKIFLERRISAVPVVDDQGKLVGIVSEGDLLHRTEAGTERRRPWWLVALSGPDTLAEEYIKAHARKVADVMTRNVITAAPDAPIHEIATLLEKNAIKRVPIVRDGQLVGLVSRANLIQAVAGARKGLEAQASDTTIRDRLTAHLKAQPWAHTALLNVIVNDGVVDLWGFATSSTEKKAVRVAAESTPGVRTVNDHVVVRSMESWT